MKLWSIISGALLFLVLLFYYLKFGANGTISDSTEVWGQFGDYLGGVLNPILSFISIVLLIRSLDFQREANNSLIKENKRQEQLEEQRKFEIKFYNMIETQKVIFDSFFITILSDEFKSTSAVTKLENIIFDLIEKSYSKDKIREVICGIDDDDNIYSVVRRFHLILNLTDSLADTKLKSEYREILINFTEYKLLCLIAIAVHYFDWDCAIKIRSSNIFNEHGLSEYISQLS